MSEKLTTLQVSDRRQDSHGQRRNFSREICFHHLSILREKTQNSSELMMIYATRVHSNDS